MTQMADVSTMLRRAAADGYPVRPDFRYDSARQGVALVLSQIDSQVLAREVVFDFDDGTRFACIASGRRLVRLLEPAPRNLHSNKVALFVQGEVTADDLDTVADLLVELCERGRRFEIAIGPHDAGIDPAQGGVSTGAIACLLDLYLPAKSDILPADELSALAESLEDKLIAAALVQDDEIALLKGEGAEATRILDWCDRLLAGLLSPSFPALATLESCGVVVFGLAQPADRHLIVAGRLGRFLVAALEGADVTDTLGKWRAVTDGSV